MKIRLKGIQEGLEWGFESVADRLGIDRRHILFGVIVLLISALLTALYIYQKNWVITGKRAAERISPVRPGKQPAIMEMDSDGKGGGVPRLVERAARHRPVGLCGCHSRHAGTR